MTPYSGSRAKRIRPFTTTAAIEFRIWELRITPVDLADRARVPHETVRHFGMFSHDQDTLERLSVVLDWPPDYLQGLWENRNGLADRWHPNPSRMRQPDPETRESQTLDSP